jgi:large conductance mechanosensitive channel
MGLIQEFKAFAMRGNVVDMAVGVIIGAAFGKVVSSLVSDVMMPIIGLATGGVSFADKKIELKAAVTDVSGAVTTPATTLNYGVLIDAIIYFVIVAFCLFMVIKGMNAAKRKEAVAPSVPLPPPRQEVLLEEIRDLLRKRA